ncbi:UDP-N-acetylglucosamine 2-epimerase (hydrolyzing) [Lysinibacillus sp. 2017]|uniref:UDP-N-acetylglucosamine 2-epimerase n=1 Tax=unclassified Lysinibacillus TaxID=2636778 RepID=UPI000D52709B|nr:MULTISPECIES: UDP-N-acetylglucosamine 2-epimerase [unclassified Lysinibacillus]AWE06393.1 UDP-N-acetylglucosamine 2-epimerase (hydrolyzing) [Lysinibacillus sp. 2017]TGN33399.1 UDP-N-acetylglucosamine 2-epimerase (hydrolyzing) [Lysinibacillus sp. S2017]
MQKKKICVVTGTRAEYGLLKRIIKLIQVEDKLQLQLLVTGMHLSSEFGYTVNEIVEDGFEINERVEILLSSDTSVGMAKSVALGILEFSTVFDRMKPDIIVILGDRFEMLAVAQTALFLKIPLAHISGGEITEGAIDDVIRHSITKMSHIHFPANEEYRNRIIQLGEQPHLVFNVGDPGVENIKKMDFLTKKELEQFFNMSIEKMFIVTYHPTTLQTDDASRQIKQLLKAIDYFKDYNVIITKGNADSEGRMINEIIDEYALLNHERVKVYTSLGSLRYLSTLKYAKAVIGNSSSGIVEAPILEIPTVNIGNRQLGRAKSNTIIDCENDSRSIIHAISRAVEPGFIESFKELDLQYDGDSTSEDIVRILKNIDLKNIIQKKFYDK